MSGNSFFDWRTRPATQRFIRFDTVRSQDVNAALDLVSAGFDAVATALGNGGGSGNAEETTTTLADGDSIDWNASNGQMAFLTLSTQRGTRVLNNPTNLKKGKYTLIITQHPSGGQTITQFGSAFVLVEDVTPSAAANSVTILHCFSNGTKVFVAKHGGPAGAAAPSPAPAPTPAPAPPPAGTPITAAFAAGINLSGMESATSTVRYGTSTYPGRNYSVPRAATIAYLASQGITKFRLCLSWEFLQPIRASSPANAAVVSAYDTTLGAYVKGGLWEPYAQDITGVLDAAQAAGVKVILDIHNDCRYRDFVYQSDGSVIGFVDPTDPLLPPYTSDASQVVGTIFAKVAPTLTQADFTDLWTKMATRWKDHAGLGGYEMMNEPNNMPAVGKNFGVNAYPAGYTGTVDYTQDFTIWPTYAQACINAIRAVDGNTPIYVGGNNWQTPIDWATNNPGFPLSGTNLIYSTHVYPDAYSSGARFDWDDEAGKHFSAGEGAVDISTTTGRTRLSQIITWAAANGNPPMAVTEYGMPVENLPDGSGLDTRWFAAAADTFAYIKAHNMEVFSWMGGDHWPTRAYPINHVPKLHQGSAVNPIVGAYLLGALGTNNATIFDEGGKWSSGGAAITRKVQARGNLTGAVTLTVASDNGGTFSKTSLTLAAGVNSEDSFTFTPAAGTIATLTYTRTGGGQVPPPVKVYALTDPVGYASTSLTDAANAILAKYKAACWLAKDALKEFLPPAAAANGDYLRGISNSGAGSTIESPMEALCWLNEDAGSLRGIEVPARFNHDSNGLPVMDMTVYGRRGLLCKKLAPVVDTSSSQNQDNYRFPAVRMPFNLKDPHFLMSCFSVASGSVGVLAAGQNMFTSAHSALRVISGPALQAEMMDKNQTSITATVSPIAANTPDVATLVYDGTYLTAYLASAGTIAGNATSAASLAASDFDSIGLGFGYFNYFPQDAIQGLHYGYIAGPGNPSDAEKVVLWNYLKSFAQPASTTSAGDALIQAYFDAPKNNAGFWGRVTTADFWNSSTDHTHPAAFGTVGSPVGASYWINHGNKTNGHDYSEPNSLDTPHLINDGTDNYVEMYHGSKIVGAGGASTKFYMCWTADFPSYQGPLLSDRDAADHGIRLRYDGGVPDTFYLDIGQGSFGTQTISLAGAWYGAYRAPGKHTLEIWCDGANIGLRIDRSATYVVTAALAHPIVPGNADLMFSGDFPDGSVYSDTRNYEFLFLKDDCPNLTDRTVISNESAAKGNL